MARDDRDGSGVEMEFMAMSPLLGKFSAGAKKT
jgi:hypothetical protein